MNHRIPLHRHNRTRLSLLGLAVSLLVTAALLRAAEPVRSDSDLKNRVEAVNKRFSSEAESLGILYKHFHSHPELSYQEEKTSARLADELRKAGFEVTEKVGGYGVVGILKNGTGPTILVRTDMDALPVIEKTGLDYASKVRTLDKSKNDVGVMHACGHDMHMIFPK